MQVHVVLTPVRGERLHMLTLQLTRHSYSLVHMYSTCVHVHQGGGGGGGGVGGVLSLRGNGGNGTDAF